MSGASCKASPERGGARRRRAEGFVPRTAKVAAALSAAVTTANQQETAPTSQAEPTIQKQPRQTPAALREKGVWGERGFSQRSRLSPKRLSTPVFSEGSAREGAFLQKRPLPRILSNPRASEQ